METNKFAAELTAMGEKAKEASYKLSAMSTEDKNRFLTAMAENIEANAELIKSENKKDLIAGEKNGLSSAMLDRLKLDDERIAGMAQGIREVIQLDDPVGEKLSSIKRDNGLEINKVSVPIGVIGIIYESRPNVTVDSAVLCLKAGNAVFLRGGSEAINSNLILSKCLSDAGERSGMPKGAFQLLPWTDREAVSFMLKMDKYIDLIIPRGGEGLIRAVTNQSTIPVIKHYKGVCHLFVDESADIAMASEIAKNAKCQRPGVCNAIETLLVHKDLAETAIAELANSLIDEGVEIRGDENICKIVSTAKPATEDDWEEEYLNLTIAMKVVENAQGAVNHINKYGSGHSDSIVSTDAKSVQLFLNQVDSSTVYHNASTRFTDGSVFGMGAEIGISTDKLHARGPMGLKELTSYKYIVLGDGQIR